MLIDHGSGESRVTLTVEHNGRGYSVSFPFTHDPEIFARIAADYLQGAARIVLKEETENGEK